MKVKCLSCQNLEAIHDPDGMLFRCGRGFYDTPEPVLFPQIYYTASGLVHGNVGIWKAEKECGDSYQLAKRKM